VEPRGGGVPAITRLRRCRLWSGSDLARCRPLHLVLIWASLRCAASTFCNQSLHIHTMSGSYPLQTPRPRQTPSPLHFERSSFISSSVLNSRSDSPTLLYDLPSTSSMTPPTSPRSKGRVISPTSPTFPGRSRAGRSGRPTPPPNARNRSTTPSGVAPSELEKFADYCRAW